MKVEILRKFFGGDYLKFDFEWFSACNRNCSYCYNLDRGPRESRSYEDITLALSKILKIPYKKIVVSLIGGEILIHPRFDDIVDFITDNKKPEHKFLLYTHAQHSPNFFRERMNKVKELNNNDCVKVLVGLHLENFKKDNFKENTDYLVENFPTTMTTLLDDNFDKWFSWYEDFLEKNKKITIEPLIFDIKEDISLISTKIKIKKNFIRFDKLKKYRDKMSMTYDIDGELYKTIDAKPLLLEKYKYDFRGWDCFLRVYETLPNGDIMSSCDYYSSSLGNIFTLTQEEINTILTPKRVRCNTICEFNLCALNCKKE